MGDVTSRKREQLGNLSIAIDYAKNFNVALDAGANSGTWSAVMAESFSKVISFEPAEDVFEELCKVSEAYGNIDAYREALGSEKGEIEVLNTKKKQHNSWSRFVRPVKHKGEIFVNKAPISTIDSLELKNLDLLKVDVEGLETQVLMGAKNTILAFKPVIIIEASSYGRKRYGEQERAMETLLEEWGAKEVYYREPDKIFVFA